MKSKKNKIKSGAPSEKYNHNRNFQRIYLFLTPQNNILFSVQFKSPFFHFFFFLNVMLMIFSRKESKINKQKNPAFLYLLPVGKLPVLIIQDALCLNTFWLSWPLSNFYHPPCTLQ